MKINLDGENYNVFITRKNNKNMYLRLKEDGIYITCNYLVPKILIENFILSNKKSVIEGIKRLEKKASKKEEFYYLGNKYEVTISNTVSKFEIIGTRIFVKNKTYLNTFLKNEAERIFNERVKICYNLFEENIPYPKVNIGKMTRKWGYNRKGGEPLIKLNFDLIHYSINEIDYVIIHELCHFLEFNHSRNFWKYVKKYCPDYKERQLVLKEE